MQDSNVPVPASVTVRDNAVQFESNADFQKRSLQHDTDSAFLGYQRKSWMKPRNDTRANREVLTTLLSSQSENSNDCIEKLLAEEISYGDLGSLTHADLQLMDFKNHKHREELLHYFAELPNQDPTYESICKLPAAKFYNRQILNSATAHLETMRSALAAANYKLQIMPPEDVIVGEKSFASRFVLEALAELKGVTDDIDKDLDELQELITAKQNAKREQRKPKKVKSKFSISPGGWVLIGSAVTTGLLSTIYYWKFANIAQ